NDLARIVNYSAFLAEHPPERTVEIVERTAWSCAHGIERWRSDCGCSTGGDPGWNQQWRTPLRDALDWLRDQVAKVFETRGADVLRDPWAARDEYINVVLDRSDESVRRFLLAHAREVAPTRLDLRRVAAHYAVASLFDNFEDDADVYCYRVTRHDFDIYRAGRARMAVASITVKSIITHEEESYEFSVLHLGETELT